MVNFQSEIASEAAIAAEVETAGNSSRTLCANQASRLSCWASVVERTRPERGAWLNRQSVMRFFTEFDDGTPDLAPLEGLVKSRVRDIARYLGASEKLYLKTPTADQEELTPGKPDEDAHGVS